MRDPKAPSRPQGTRCVAAYDLFLRGRAFYLRGLAAHNLHVAAVFLRRAVELDEGFARAHAQLAICESHRFMVLHNQLDDAQFDACLRHSERALQLDAGLAEAHAGMGLAYYGAGDYRAAGRHFATAVAHDDELFEAHFFQARNHRLEGDRARAAALFERAAELRPRDFRAPGLLGEELQALGHGALACEQFGECLRRVEAEVAVHPDNAGALAFGSAVLADLGRAEQAREWAEWAVLIAPQDCLVHYNVARTRLMLGNDEAALAALRIAFRTSQVSRRRLALWMRHDQDLAPLAENAEYERMLDFSEPTQGALSPSPRRPAITMGTAEAFASSPPAPNGPVP